MSCPPAPYGSPSSSGWSYASHPATAQPSSSAPAATALVPPPVGGRGLLITSIVLASAALAAVLGVVVWLAATGGPLGDGGGYAPLTGQVAPRGGAVSGEDLAAVVRQRIRDDGGSPTRMNCPDTPTVAHSTTTVCHGVIDEDDWAVVVFFEDSSGNYTLLPI